MMSQRKRHRPSDSRYCASAHVARPTALRSRSFIEPLVKGREVDGKRMRHTPGSRCTRFRARAERSAKNPLTGRVLPARKSLTAFAHRCAHFRIANHAFVLRFVGRDLRCDRDASARCLDFEILAAPKGRPPQDARRLTYFAPVPTTAPCDLGVCRWLARWKGPAAIRTRRRASYASPAITCALEDEEIQSVLICAKKEDRSQKSESRPCYDDLSLRHEKPCSQYCLPFRPGLVPRSGQPDLRVRPARS